MSTNKPIRHGNTDYSIPDAQRLGLIPAGGVPVEPEETPTESEADQRSDAVADSPEEASGQSGPSLAPRKSNRAK